MGLAVKWWTVASPVTRAADHHIIVWCLGHHARITTVLMPKLKSKLKAWKNQRRVGLTQQVTPLVMRVCEHYATPLGVPECSTAEVLISTMAHKPVYERSCVFLLSTMAHTPVYERSSWSSESNSLWRSLLLNISKISLWRSSMKWNVYAIVCCY